MKMQFPPWMPWKSMEASEIYLVYLPNVTLGINFFLSDYIWYTYLIDIYIPTIF